VIPNARALYSKEARIAEGWPILHRDHYNRKLGRPSVGISHATKESIPFSFELDQGDWLLKWV